MKSYQSCLPAVARDLFVVDVSSCRLAVLHDRVSRKHLIDKLHHAMQLWKEEKRGFPCRVV